ncbi:MAG: DUF2029 domain-containing protein [Prevotellaceae bacterium]|jgi:hypothetical protein|nr:DUF2029 domain-containing protein [Prevotellaceae bacterium]
MKQPIFKFFTSPRNLYIIGFIIIVGLSFSEVFRGRQNTFRIFYESTRLFWDGIVPYGDTWKLMASGLDNFIYGPVFNVFFTPFAFLPEWLSPYVWNIFNYTLYFLAIFTLPNKYTLEEKCKTFLFTFLILATTQLAFQYNPTIAYLFVFAFSLLERNKPFWAIMLILFSGFTKIYGIFQLGLLVCYPKFWRNILYVAIGCVFFFFLPAINVKIGNIFSYYQNWVDMLVNHQDTRTWDTFFYIQPWGNITSIRMYIQIGTLLALVSLLFVNHKKFKSFEFRAQVPGILMGWLILFSNVAEKHTYVIALLGYMLWYWSMPYLNSSSTTKLLDKILFYAAFFIMVIVPIDILCPPFIMRFLFYKLSLNLWLFTFIWFRMCFVTFIKDFLPYQRRVVLTLTMRHPK